MAEPQFCLNCGSSETSQWHVISEEICDYFNLKLLREVKYVCNACRLVWFKAKNTVWSFFQLASVLPQK